MVRRVKKDLREFRAASLEKNEEGKSNRVSEDEYTRGKVFKTHQPKILSLRRWRRGEKEISVTFSTRRVR